MFSYYNGRACCGDELRFVKGSDRTSSAVNQVAVAAVIFKKGWGRDWKLGNLKSEARLRSLSSFISSVLALSL
jgi:hypothetical protein